MNPAQNARAVSQERSPGIGRALLDSLEPDDLAELADRLAPFLPQPATDDDWLTTPAAAAYLQMSIHSLHRLTSQRRIPFHQQRPNAKTYFRRSELDEWRSR